MKKDKALVSVIIPTYNRPDLLKRSIESILAQTYSNFEIIVINDGGQDISHIFPEWETEKIRYFNLSENRGRGYARNIGIKNSSGKYLSYLDDDDLFYPMHLETLINFLEENPSFKAVYSGSYMTILEKAGGNYKVLEKKPLLPEKFDYDSMLVIGPLPILSVIHHKTCIDETGYFDETLNCNEDWDFWIRMAGKFNFANINKITNEFFYRTDKDMENFYETRKVIYERYKSLNHPYEVEIERAKKLREQSISPDYNFRKGRELFNAEKYLEAINFFSLYLKSEPSKKYEVLMLIGESLKKIGDEKSAAIFFEKAKLFNQSY